MCFLTPRHESRSLPADGAVAHAAWLLVGDDALGARHACVAGYEGTELGLAEVFQPAAALLAAQPRVLRCPAPSRARWRSCWSACRCLTGPALTEKVGTRGGHALLAHRHILPACVALDRAPGVHGGVGVRRCSSCTARPAGTQAPQAPPCADVATTLDDSVSFAHAMSRDRATWRSGRSGSGC